MTSPTNPFSHWTILDPNITDPNNGGIDTLSITFSGGGTLTDGADFAGTRTLSGSNGSYTLTGTPADINAELNALSFNGAPNTSFTLSDRFIVALAVSFNGADGADPQAGLISDAAGNLLGTTAGGGANGGGTVFELANIGTVSAPIHSGTPTTLWSFTGGADGGAPVADLMRDAAGDLFGTTSSGGTGHGGTVFEIANTGTVSAPVYSSTPTTLWSFNGTNGSRPQAGLISDAAGDLFGTTSQGGLSGGLINTRGTVFEIANTGSVDAPVYGTLTTLVRFGPSSGGGAPGSDPHADLIIDAAGDLFGTTASTAFELVNTGTVSAPVYSSTPTTLFTDGAEPAGSLARDAAGDLFGTTEFGGSGAGTVYEIANGTRTTLWAFSGGAHGINDGANPLAGLIIDAAGDLFGTTRQGGTNNLGTVFELVNTGTVSAPNYLNTFRTLWSFTGGADGRVPLAGLSSDAAGDLFGTTSQGGTSGQGAVFELVKTDSGYTMAPSFTGTLAGQTTVSEAPVTPFSGVTITDLNKFGGSAADTLSIMFSGGGTLTDGAGFAGTSTLSGSNGHYTLTGTAADITTELDALSFTPVNGVPNTQVTTHFTLFDQGGATDNVLASFNGDNGAFPLGSLIIDAAGDLLGTTSQGGPGGSGTVFEIANTGTVSAPIYSSTPTTLVAFDGTDGGFPVAGLIRDAAGDLFGTTQNGGSSSQGTVFEIANTGSVSAPVYSNTPTTLWSFTGGTDGGAPAAGLIVDAAGNLFGTTETGGTDGHGTVFEIANSGSVGTPVYSNTPTTLWSFTGGADGSDPTGSLTSDAAGDLFGTTDSTVFELANTGTVSAPAYGSAPTTLASFGGSGLISGSGLIINAAGDLFGTTLSGGAHGAVFELVNTGTVSAPSYGDTPVTLVSFTGGDDGDLPFGGVVSDAAGDLFGTTYQGGGRGGTVFEVVNTGTVSAPIYSSTPRTLWTFSNGGADGENPQAGLTIDAAGDLFGTTLNGGSGGAGTAFELARTGSVYTFLSAIDMTTSVADSDPAVAPTITGTVAGQTTTDKQTENPFSGVTIGDANNGGTNTDTLTVTLDHTANGTLSHPGGGSYDGATGIYSVSGTAAAVTAALEGLVFTPTANQVTPGSTVTSTFTIAVDDGIVATVTDVNTTVVATSVNDAPTIITGAVTVGYTEQQSAPAAILVDNAITVGDPDAGAQINSATVKITGGAFAGDLLDATPTGNITVAWNGSDTLTLTGPDTIADYQQVLGSVTFSSPSEDPTNGGTDPTRTVTWTVKDNFDAASAPATSTISVTAVNDAPVATTPVAHYTATEQTNLSLKNTGLSVSDSDGNAGSETVTLSVGEGILTLAAGTSGAVIDSGNGSNSVTFHGTIAQIDDLLNTNATSAVTYNDNTDNPSANTTLTLQINDNGHTGTGGPLVAIATSTVDITAVNDAPALVGVAPTAAYTPGTAGDVLSPALGVFDPDATPPSPNIGLASATVSIASGFLADDELFVNLATSGGHFITPDGDVTNISVQSSVLGALILSGTDTVSHYQAILDAVSYHSTAADPSNGGTDPTRTITWKVNDGVLDSQAPPPETLLHFDTAPQVDLDASGAGTGFSTTYTENAAPISITDTDLSITSPDTANLDSATIVLTNAKAADSLSIAGTLPDGIDSTIDTSVAGQITVHLSNSASLADYQTAVGQIRFSTSGDAPDTTDRDITVSVSESGVDSNTAHATVHVVAVNDPPVNTMPGSVNAISSTDNAITGLAVSDPDAVSLTTSLHVEHGILTLSAVGGGAAIAGSGTSTVTLTGSVSQIDATLAAANNILYRSEFNFSGVDHLTMTSNDGGGTGVGGPMTDTDTTDVHVSPPPFGFTIASAVGSAPPPPGFGPVAAGVGVLNDGFVFASAPSPAPASSPAVPVFASSDPSFSPAVDELLHLTALTSSIPDIGHIPPHLFGSDFHIT